MQVREKGVCLCEKTVQIREPFHPGYYPLPGTNTVERASYCAVTPLHAVG